MFKSLLQLDLTPKLMLPSRWFKGFVKTPCPSPSSVGPLIQWQIKVYPYSHSKSVTCNHFICGCRLHLSLHTKRMKALDSSIRVTTFIYFRSIFKKYLLTKFRFFLSENWGCIAGSRCNWRKSGTLKGLRIQCTSTTLVKTVNVCPWS